MIGKGHSGRVASNYMYIYGLVRVDIHKVLILNPRGYYLGSKITMVVFV